MPERHGFTQRYILQLNFVPNIDTTLTTAQSSGGTEPQTIGTQKIETALYVL
jgi:hypothetical protein